MQKYANTVTDTLGNVVSLASVSVYTDAGHTTLATVYSDNGITPTTNPRTTDSLGNFSFYAADGRYYIKVTKTGVTTQFLDDVILFDPTASNSAASINTVQSGTGAVSTSVQTKIRQFATTPQDYGAVADSTGVAGNGTDNVTYFQAALDAIHANGGGTLYIPDSGSSWYRLSGTIRGYANTTILGSRNARLFFDTTDFGNTPASVTDRTDFKQAAIVFHSGDATAVTKVTVRSYSGPTEIENCWVKGITVKSRGAYLNGYVATHKAIRLHGCARSGIVDCRIEGFNGEAAYANEYGYDILFADNYVTNCAHAACNFNGRIYNSKISRNSAYRVLMLIEATGWDNTFIDNSVDTYNGNGIWVSDDSLSMEASASVVGNRIINGVGTSNYPILLNSSVYNTNIIVANNFIRGSFTDGMQVFNGSSGAGGVHISGNVIVDETTGGTPGLAIRVADFTSRVNVHGNHVYITTDNLYGAIGITASPGSLCNVWGNSVHTNGHTARGAATNLGGWFTTGASLLMMFFDNVVDGQVISSPANAPITNTGATYSVGALDSVLIANKAGTQTLTLPAAATNSGRTLRVKTITANTVVSDASNVVPAAGGAAGTAILAATAGKWADLTSDGTSWVIMASN